MVRRGIEGTLLLSMMRQEEEVVPEMARVAADLSTRTQAPAHSPSECRVRLQYSEGFQMWSGERLDIAANASDLILSDLTACTGGVVKSRVTDQLLLLH